MIKNWWKYGINEKKEHDAKNSHHDVTFRIVEVYVFLLLLSVSDPNFLSAKSVAKFLENI